MTLSCYQPRFNTSKDLICTLLFASDQPQQCGTGERTANRHLVNLTLHPPNLWKEVHNDSTVLFLPVLKS